MIHFTRPQHTPISRHPRLSEFGVDCTKGLDNLDLVGAQREPGTPVSETVDLRIFERSENINESSEKVRREYENMTSI